MSDYTRDLPGAMRRKNERPKTLRLCSEALQTTGASTIEEGLAA